MGKEFISVKFTSTEEKAALIEALLFDAGYHGAEEKEGEYIITSSKENFDEEVLEAIMKDQEVEYSIECVPDQNWNAQWESSFEPVQVDDFAMIRAAFHQPGEGVAHDIIITPKMSFGTGHHATTYLMIRLMKDIDFAGKTVTDFGTGTGVLAILAEKLGAAAALAIDNDEWSIRNSQENIAANDCHHIQLELAEEMLQHDKADIILANINLNVIVANLEKIKESCKENALVLFSGLMTADEEIISIHLKNNGFYIEKIEHRNGWIALLTKPLRFPQD